MTDDQSIDIRSNRAGADGRLRTGGVCVLDERSSTIGFGCRQLWSVAASARGRVGNVRRSLAVVMSGLIVFTGVWDAVAEPKDSDTVTTVEAKRADLTNEQLTDIFARTLVAPKPVPKRRDVNPPKLRRGAKWHGPLTVHTFIPSPRDTQVDETASELRVIVQTAIAELKVVTGLDISEVQKIEDANVRLAFYGDKLNSDAGYLMTPAGWDAKPTINQFSYKGMVGPIKGAARWVYGGLALVDARGPTIHRASCAATYRLRGEYRADLTVRRFRLAGTAPVEIARRFKKIKDTWKWNEPIDTANDPGLQEFMRQGKALAKEIPADGACARTDYLDRWRLIVDACFTEILGISAGALETHAERRIAAVSTSLLTVISGQRYQTNTTDSVSRYGRLFLSTLYRSGFDRNRDAQAARSAILQHIKGHRLQSLDRPRPMSCAAMP